MMRLAVVPLVLLALAGCRDDAEVKVPPPVAISAQSGGYYCGMSLSEMDGPKAQAALEGYPAPLFFSQVRDGIAYLKSPEQEARILAFYVSNMSKAKSWAEPGDNNWILAKDAYYVVGAKITGGMGAPEIVPYGEEADARAFAASHGGQIMRLEQIPASAVLAPVDKTPQETTQ